MKWRMKSLGTELVGRRDAAVHACPSELVLDGGRKLLQSRHEVLQLVGQGAGAALQSSKCAANRPADTIKVEFLVAIELEEGDDLVLSKQRLLLALLGPKLDRPVVLGDERPRLVNDLGIGLRADERVCVLELCGGLFSVGRLAVSQANLCDYEMSGACVSGTFTECERERGRRGERERTKQCDVPM